MSFQPRTLEELALDFPPELDHISASSLKMAVRCEEQWRQRYILGKKEAPALAMLAGRADHGAIEKSMHQKVETKEDLPIPVVKDTFLELLESDVDWHGGLNELEVKGAQTPAERMKVYDDLRREGPEVVAAYQRLASPHVQPLTVEQEFRLKVPGLPVEVLGYIDLTAEGEGPGERRIIDRKRRARKTLKIEPEWSIQAEIYQLVVPAPHEWHLSVTTKTPQIVFGEPELTQRVPRFERSERLLQQLVAKIGWLYMRFGPDEPWPTSGKLHPWACSYCGFRDDCWGWQ